MNEGTILVMIALALIFLTRFWPLNRGVQTFLVASFLILQDEKKRGGNRSGLKSLAGLRNTGPRRENFALS